MSQLRFNPLLNTWVIHSAERQHRPHLPTGQCPFCPHSGNVPDHYEVLVYPNDFPVLSDSNLPEEEIHPLYPVKEAYGYADVVLYSSNHNTSFSQLSRRHITKIVETWIERNNELSADGKIEYVYPFENRGEEVGVTMHHPHGQIYAFSWVPPKVDLEIRNCVEHFHSSGGYNMFDVITKVEREDGRRLLYENQSFIAYLPYFTDYPFGVFVVAKDAIVNLSEFNAQHTTDLADILKAVTGGFDKLYDKPFPYMMVTHQAPVNGGSYGDMNEYYRYHIEFYPPLRERDKIKYYASSEMGAGVATNPNSLEECAALLRSKIAEVSKYE